MRSCARRRPADQGDRRVVEIVDLSGNELMEGLDIAERDGAGRLRRIVMFHGGC
jgi:hypothetical protein